MQRSAGICYDMQIVRNLQVSGALHLQSRTNKDNKKYQTVPNSPKIVTKWKYLIAQVEAKLSTIPVMTALRFLNWYMHTMVVGK